MAQLDMDGYGWIWMDMEYPKLGLDMIWIIAWAVYNCIYIYLIIYMITYIYICLYIYM